jgi:hypothetical protein
MSVEMKAMEYVIGRIRGINEEYKTDLKAVIEVKSYGITLRFNDNKRDVIHIHDNTERVYLDTVIDEMEQNIINDNSVFVASFLSEKFESVIVRKCISNSKFYVSTDKLFGLTVLEATSEEEAIMLAKELG